MPRSTKLTPAVHAKIVAFVRGGVYLETAAKAAGVGVRTFREWMHRGAHDPDSIYSELAADVEEALGQDEVRTVIRHEQLSGKTMHAVGRCDCGQDAGSEW